MNRFLSFPLLCGAMFAFSGCTPAGYIASKVTDNDFIQSRYGGESIVRQKDKTGHIMFPDKGDEYDRTAMPTLALETAKGDGKMFYIRGAFIPSNKFTNEAAAREMKPKTKEDVKRMLAAMLTAKEASLLGGRQAQARVLYAAVDVDKRLVALASTNNSIYYSLGRGWKTDFVSKPVVVSRDGAEALQRGVTSGYDGKAVRAIRADGREPNASLGNNTLERIVDADVLLPISYGSSNHYRINLFRVDSDELLAVLKKVANTNANCSELALRAEMGFTSQDEYSKAGCSWLYEDRKVLVDAFRDGIGLVNVSDTYPVWLVLTSTRMPGAFAYFTHFVENFVTDYNRGGNSAYSDFEKFGHIHEGVGKFLKAAGDDKVLTKIKEAQKPLDLKNVVVKDGPGPFHETYTGSLDDVIARFNQQSVKDWSKQPSCYGPVAGKTAGFADVWSLTLGVVNFQERKFPLAACSTQWIKTDGSPSISNVTDIKNARISYVVRHLNWETNYCSNLTATLKIDNKVAAGYPATKVVCFDPRK